MTDALSIGLSIAGVAGGVVLAVVADLSSTLARSIALVAAATMSGLIVVRGWPPMVGFVAGVGLGVAITVIWWHRRPDGTRRAAALFDRVTRRDIVVHELGGAGRWAGAALVLSALVTTTATSASSVRWLAPVLVAATGAGLTSRAGAGVEGLGGVGTAPPHDEAECERWAVVPHPPVLFRGLAGWNLGLGLDAEQSAWARQLARRLGLDDMLIEPEFGVDPERSWMLLACRGLAQDSDVLVVELGGERLAPQVLRPLTRLVAETLGPRRLIVRSPDPAVAAGFLERVRSAM